MHVGHVVDVCTIFGGSSSLSWKVHPFWQGVVHEQEVDS